MGQLGTGERLIKVNQGGRVVVSGTPAGTHTHTRTRTHMPHKYMHT